MKIKIFIIALLLFIILGCDNSLESNSQASKNNLVLSQITLSPKENTNRWYFSEQSERGRTVFASNCVVCHGNNAEATPNWKTRTASGHYPPPPLNGTAHAWHHPLRILNHTIRNGGATVGGQMPAFKNKLNPTDIVDVIAYFQSYWTNDVYEAWLSIEKSSRE